jgi:hypothetical protein
VLVTCLGSTVYIPVTVVDLGAQELKVQFEERIKWIVKEEIWYVPKLKCVTYVEIRTMHLLSTSVKHYY